MLPIGVKEWVGLDMHRTDRQLESDSSRTLIAPWQSFSIEYRDIVCRGMVSRVDNFENPGRRCF